MVWNCKELTQFLPGYFNPAARLTRPPLFVPSRPIVRLKLSIEFGAVPLPLLQQRPGHHPSRARLQPPRRQDPHHRRANHITSTSSSPSGVPHLKTTTPATATTSPPTHLLPDQDCGLLALLIRRMSPLHPRACLERYCSEVAAHRRGERTTRPIPGHRQPAAASRHFRKHQSRWI
jgi:hypothetical protein